MPLSVVADQGYSSHGFRQHIREVDAKLASPTSATMPRPLPGLDLPDRNGIERPWARPKEWRAVAAFYENTDRNFTGVLCLAAALDWIE